MLTDDQKSQVRFYLGQGDLFRYLNPRLESIWDTLSPEAEARIIVILGQLAVVDAQMFGTGGAASLISQAAGIKSVDEISFAGGDAGGGSAIMATLAKQGKMLAGRLSSIIGVPVYSDVFGTGGWEGDMYSNMGWPNGVAGRGIIRLG